MKASGGEWCNRRLREYKRDLRGACTGLPGRGARQTTGVPDSGQPLRRAVQWLPPEAPPPSFGNGRHTKPFGYKACGRPDSRFALQ
jgi:hypothetical protein